MSLEQTAELYASVLRQLLPDGVYDTAEMTHVADDIYAHAKALAQADIDAHRLLRVLETIPVDLLADYEREYGLPMQCMVPGSQTIEERIHVLRWIRQHRNVMNREYLEQILAIFDVTLVDVVKHRPMLCTAPCTSPVNTERLRYKVLLRLQYPMTADMSCIIENYLPGYLRVEWVVDMPWGEWVLNAGYELSGDNIHYTAHKTNQRDFYDSYADFDLLTALVRSFHDTDMQQWQGVSDAIEALSANAKNYTFDTENDVINIQYIVADPDLDAVASTLTQRHSTNPLDFVGLAAFQGLVEGIGWVMDEGGKVTKLPTPEEQQQYDEQNAKYTSPYTYEEYILGGRIIAYSLASFCSQYAGPSGTVVNIYPQSNSCTWRSSNNPNLQAAVAQVFTNPDYDPSYTPSEPPAPVATDAEIENALKNALESNNPALAAAIAEAIEDAYAYDPIAGSNDLYSSRVITKTFIQLAEQIKQNASSINIETALHAENYIDQVANSIFDLPPAKQFVLYADLITQFDLNKTLRN